MNALHDAPNQITRAQAHRNTLGRNDPSRGCISELLDLISAQRGSAAEDKRHIERAGKTREVLTKLAEKWDAHDHVAGGCPSHGDCAGCEFEKGLACCAEDLRDALKEL